MIILGIDPGTATTGFGIIRVVGNSIKPVDYGIISTPPGVPDGAAAGDDLRADEPDY